MEFLLVYPLGWHPWRYWWGVAFLNIYTRDINASLCALPILTCGIYGAGLCSAKIKSCVEWFFASVEDICVMLNCFGKNSTVSDIISALFWGFMPYGIYIIPLLIPCNRRLIHEVPMTLYSFYYFERLFLSLVGLTVCGCNRIIQIFGCRLIGGEELLIVWENLDWLLPAVVICIII